MVFSDKAMLSCPETLHTLCFQRRKEKVTQQPETKPSELAHPRVNTGLAVPDSAQEEKFQSCREGQRAICICTPYFFPSFINPNIPKGAGKITV
jgi:hypothetical protein